MAKQIIAPYQSTKKQKSIKVYEEKTKEYITTIDRTIFTEWVQKEERKKYFVKYNHKWYRLKVVYPNGIIHGGVAVILI